MKGEEPRRSDVSACVRRALFAPIVLALGCQLTPPPRVAMQPADDAEARAANAVVAVTAEQATKGTLLRDVEGRVCKVGLHDPDPREEEAIEQLRLAVVREGANAIVGTTCESGGTNLVQNCFATVTCHGTAVLMPSLKSR